MNIKNIFLFCLDSIMLFCISTLLCIINTWDNVSLNEIIFHINNGVDGTSPRIVIKFALFILIPQVIFILFVVRKFSPAKATRLILALFILSAVFFASKTYDNIEYIVNYSQPSIFIEENYINPGDVDIHFRKKNNLIHIYLESIESSFTSEEHGGVFGENLIPRLTKLAQENIDFSGGATALNGARPIHSTTWTAASMFAQSAGVPLNDHASKSVVLTQKSFYPGLVMLGDILAKNGYLQTFLLGSDSTFAGKNRLFIDHGNFNIIDYNVMLSRGMIPQGYHQGWGVEDSKMFEIAKSTVTQLSKQNRPFNFVLLTVDTHAPDCHVDTTCGAKFNDKYKDAVYCSDTLVGEFVEWITKQDFYKNTTVVITGDHLTRQPGFIKNNSVIKSDSGYIRKAYSCYMNTVHADFKDTEYRTYSLFDHFPTILSAIGAEIPGNRLGLGTNLFSNEKTLSEKHGYVFQDRELQRRSTFLENLGAADMSKMYMYDNILLKVKPKICDGAIEYMKLEGNEGNKLVNFGGWVLHSDTQKHTPPSIILMKSSAGQNTPDKFTLVEKMARPDIADTLKVNSSDEFGFSAAVPYGDTHFIGYRYGTTIYQCKNLVIAGNVQ